MFVQGSFSKCFELTESVAGEKFAGKVISKDFDMRSICNEIEIHSKLRHQHIVGLIGIIHDRYNVYIVQSLCTNGTLKGLLRERGTVSVDECRYFIAQILNGVQYIHSMNVIHRDLKLTNIFIDERVQVRIGDFGLSIDSTKIQLEQNKVCGTLRYLSPEVLQHKGFSCKSDVWAVGAMMYNLLFGCSPFEADKLRETAKRIRKIDYRFVLAVKSDCHCMQFL